MLSMTQLAAFSDELQKIASVKAANMSQLQQAFQQPPQHALGTIKPKAPKKSTLTPGSVNAYSKVNSIAAQSPVYQPVSPAPNVMS